MHKQAINHKQAIIVLLGNPRLAGGLLVEWLGAPSGEN